MQNKYKLYAAVFCFGLLALGLQAYTQMLVPYSPDDFGLRRTPPRPDPFGGPSDEEIQITSLYPKQIEDSLKTIGVAPRDIAYSHGSVRIEADLEEHNRIFEHFKPQGQWAYGFVYFKLSRTDVNNETTIVRYYAQLPHFPSGRRFSEKLLFKLEPIYSKEALKAIAPLMPCEFRANISLTSNIDMHSAISMMCEIQQKDLPTLSTEFAVNPKQLLHLGGASVTTRQTTTSGEWQARFILSPKTDKTVLIREQIEGILNTGTKPIYKHDIDELKKFFERAGIEFSGHPRRQLVFDEERLILRLPPHLMQKMRSILASYNDIYQNTISTSYTYTQDKNGTIIKLSATSLSGKGTTISAPNLEIFGYVNPESESIPSMQMSFTANNDSIGTLSVLLNTDCRNALGQNSIENAQEITLPTGHSTRIAQHEIAKNNNAQSWSLDLACEPTNIEVLPPTPESKQIGFIPISRFSVYRIVDLHRTERHGAIDPFEAPQREPNPDYGNPANTLEAYFRGSGLFEGDADASIAFDGEQLILDAKQSTIERIRKVVLEASYRSPIIGKFELENSNGKNEAIHTQTMLISDSGKVARFTISKEGKDSKDYQSRSGAEFSFSPTAERMPDALNKLFADAELNYKEAGTKLPWSLEIRRSPEGFESKQVLPPSKSAYSWKLEELKVFEE